MTPLQSDLRLQSQPRTPEQGHRPHRSQALRHADTAAVATRRSAPWTPVEDEELAACVSADDLEAFALRWLRTFRAVEQRRRRPRPFPSAGSEPGPAGSRTSLDPPRKAVPRARSVRGGLRPPSAAVNPSQLASPGATVIVGGIHTSASPPGRRRPSRQSRVGAGAKIPTPMVPLMASPSRSTSGARQSDDFVKLLPSRR
jgi:hypothetical protein